MKRVTSKDVAAYAGVSRTTVSYVVNNKSGENFRISEETRKKVWDAVNQLGFRPSAAAVSLRTRKSKLIALMIPHIESPFHPLLASAVQDAAEEKGYDVLIYSTRDDLKKEQKFIDTVIGRQVDGVIAQSYRLSKAELDSLVNAGVSVVIVGPTPSHPLADNIFFEERKSVAQVIQRFADKGHTRIGHISGPRSTWAGNERILGYLDGLRFAYLERDEDLIQEADFYREETAVRAMENFFRLDSPPTAIFAASDVLAVTSILYCIDKGFRIPDDIAIVGMDDLPIAHRIRPRLSTVRKDIDTLGSQAVDLLLSRIEGEAPRFTREQILSCSFVERESD